ncbi:50S ribosomal protein L6 [Mycoplasmopsis californica HAZ160_1]|uniref:50S ribosomal protein L6 n=2 Tax=Mycoplasmopsis californica TaxID=2113 RepID=A0A059XM54_9BACT|nr:50S ribosomal protein L6 [Mycoplasmopsis californica]AIA29604.1 50S ribosomal protein L6 [Mycoplasmopsis californica]BAP00957.1 50S ribosomal protein L6 [Mycoplasmopsis californica HAZ160_1]BBG40821.1 50S ribosomal protein L6 [Mycoplasmopsis californica]BBG41415.1 50S ribosomal protein L6 [Mycoplasmopsis californica]BBG42008.1 50S ribosomal protein L6 [Mycoplasmopsis californica]
MSRVGNRILTIPAGVEINLDGTMFSAKGKLGTLSANFSPLIAIKIEDGKISTLRANEEKTTKQLHGTTNALIANMLVGVSSGFKKELVIKGVGYKATLKGQQLELAVGKSHLELLDIPSDVQVELPKPTEIILSSISKESVGQFAAIVRATRKPSPYSGKGVAYKDEIIRRKEGKTAAK